ncbi:hypothetical protein POM88_032559 [Heracleum sosnowskyi]|uniref:Uncharacterized protein n=1 Tax=Heracleum sosnowskyi TaxID=360622 RepID=A0AAD8MK62_9APIA|nr:hypothetical protein POM88_032559 [Heracleum sosnowskyi]
MVRSPFASYQTLPRKSHSKYGSKFQHEAPLIHLSLCVAALHTKYVFKEANRGGATEPTSLFDRSSYYDDRSCFAGGLYDVSKQTCPFFFLFCQTDEQGFDIMGFDWERGLDFIM